MRRQLAPLVVICVISGLCWSAIRSPDRNGSPAAEVALDASVQTTADRVNEFFEQRWQSEKLHSAELADDLQVLRRLTLALMGTVPSLEEIRQFEADAGPQRLARWTKKLLADRRSAEYLAQRLARCYVGADDGPFIVFRRDRFNQWLSEQLLNRTPYDELVRRMVGSQGLWTGQPESNFITSAFANDDLDENKLAARTARAFLGQSMDCAQCHNHFFAEWKQSQFAGLASYFGKTEIGLGVHEKPEKQFMVLNRKTMEEEAVSPAVPFHAEWLPESEGEPREQLGRWLTHPSNRRFERAIANRIWGLMFGRPFIAPVDDMPNPPDEKGRDVLDILGQDFREHGCDLSRLIEVIAASKPFRLSSQHPAEDVNEVEQLQGEWAVFPLVRLRPEQIIGSMLQAAYVGTIDQNSHVFVRFQRFVKEKDFVKAYGDLGDQELVDRSGTIPQALLRMNSDLTREAINADPLSSTNRIANMCKTNANVVEVAYLCCLARRPTGEETTHFLSLLGDRRGDAREVFVEDIFWTLFNSPEFSWNH